MAGVQISRCLRYMFKSMVFPGTPCRAGRALPHGEEVASISDAGSSAKSTFRRPAGGAAADVGPAG